MSISARLFDYPADPMVRSTDPETSRAAAPSVDVNVRESEVLDALRWLGVAATTHQIQDVLARFSMKRDRNCIARRLTSLEGKGKVRRAGVRKGGFGRQVISWALT